MHLSLPRPQAHPMPPRARVTPKFPTKWRQPVFRTGGSRISSRAVLRAAAHGRKQCVGRTRVERCTRVLHESNFEKKLFDEFA